MIRRGTALLLALSTAVLAAGLVCGRVPPDATAPSPATRGFDAVWRAERATKGLPDAARARAIGEEYDARLGPVARGGLASLGHADLDLLHRAAHTTAFHTLSAAHLGAVRATLDELERRGLAAKRHVIHAHELLIKARRLDEATALAARHPSLALEAVPALRQAGPAVRGRPGAWSVDSREDALVRRSIDPGAPAHVVVVSHPLCHFSRAAMEAVGAAPALTGALRGHATYLAPQDGSFHLDVLRAWDQAHPDQAIAIALDRVEWPWVDSWETPTFYFLEGGAVVAKVSGWPSGGRLAELEEGARRIGLLAAVR